MSSRSVARVTFGVHVTLATRWLDTWDFVLRKARASFPYAGPLEDLRLKRQ